MILDHCTTMLSGDETKDITEDDTAEIMQVSGDFAVRAEDLPGIRLEARRECVVNDPEQTPYAFEKKP